MPSESISHDSTETKSDISHESNNNKRFENVFWIRMLLWKSYFYLKIAESCNASLYLPLPYILPLKPICSKPAGFQKSPKDLTSPAGSEIKWSVTLILDYCFPITVVPWCDLTYAHPDIILFLFLNSIPCMHSVALVSKVCKMTMMASNIKYPIIVQIAR